MEIEIFLIRSGMTASDKAQRYLGKSDEPLCDEGIMRLEERVFEKRYPKPERLYTASSNRCRQTMAIIYPGCPAVVAEGFSAFDYGCFEGKTYSELCAEPLFTEWTSGKLTNPPDAEDANILIYKNVAAFRAIMKECVEKSIKSVAIITHKNAIVSVSRRMCIPRSVYQNVGIGHGEGLCLLYDSYANMVKIKNFF